MIKAIIRFSATNKYLVVAATMVALAGAWWSMKNIPLDALPDLSDTQVIVYSKWDRSPDIIEDQVTYPITTALLGAPRVKAIRGFSDFGFSYVYVIFEDNTDLYWARTRVLEYLSKIQPQLPAGVTTELGPDASSVGWVFQYALVDRSGTRSVVFVALGDGKFQPRVVRLGATDGDQIEVQDGLSPGDEIVSRANFLVDSESRLKASLQALGGGK